jgi:hypothetical protein
VRATARGATRTHDAPHHTIPYHTRPCRIIPYRDHHRPPRLNPSFQYIPFHYSHTTSSTSHPSTYPPYCSTFRHPCTPLSSPPLAGSLSFHLSSSCWSVDPPLRLRSSRWTIHCCSCCDDRRVACFPFTFDSSFTLAASSHRTLNMQFLLAFLSPLTYNPFVFDTVTCRLKAYPLQTH